MTSERERKMINAYRDGSTLQEIGNEHGISRERVRQILARNGVSSDEGGATVRAATNAAQRAAKRDERCLSTWGCSRELWDELRSLHVDYWKSPVGRYYTQMRNAGKRGIEWQLTLAEWWEIWDSSGMYERRGLNAGQYVMARFGDVGPYSAKNVYITKSSENIKEYVRREYPVEKNADAWLYARPLTPEQIYEQLECDEDAV